MKITTMMLWCVPSLLVACERPPAASTRELGLANRAADPEAAVAGELVRAPSEEAELVWSDQPAPDPDADEDGDGFTVAVDVDDRDPFTHPGARDEPCDGVDQDDDGIDPCPADSDGDGIVEGPDCDDGDPGVSPRALEIPCNGVDENCNGLDACAADDEDGAVDHGDADPRDPGVQ